MKKQTRIKAMLAALLPASMAAVLVVGGACSPKAQPSQQPQPQREMDGVVQAVDGEEAVITLDDGRRIRVEIDSSAKGVKGLIGEDVTAVVQISEDKPKLVEVKKKSADDAGVPEDLHFSGIIESKGQDKWVIGGKTFKVNAATILDQGLEVGEIADVEFIKLSDGSLLATKIETEGDDDGVQTLLAATEDFNFTGVVISLSADKIVVADKTFIIDGNTIVDNGVAAGALVTVEFIVKPDGSFLALEIESDNESKGNKLVKEDMFANGPIESITKDAVVVDGRTFKIVATTVLDGGIEKGVLVKVEFLRQPDGSLMAKKIERTGIDEGVNLYFSGPIQSISATAYVVGGKTFMVTPLTKLDTGLVVGAIADVQFTIQPDGTMVAAEIETGGFEFIGMLQSISATSYVAGGRTFLVNAATLVDRGLKVKKLVKVKFIIQANGSMLAKVITAANTKLLGFSFKGVVQTMGPATIVVSTRTFQVSPATVMAAGVAANKQVVVRFDVLPGGAMLAQNIQLAQAVKK
ncbi:MAG: hypothetical protein HYX90_02295 [Chloroflexi bacterium]|nr:hypothetical protein [Chloroflexota bacterium]